VVRSPGEGYRHVGGGELLGYWYYTYDIHMIVY
jgi:hypothetical protein